MESVKLPYEERFFVRTDYWELYAIFEIEPYEKVLEELTTDIEWAIRYEIISRLRKYYDMNNPEKSLNKIYQLLLNNYYNVLGNVHEFIRKYSMPVETPRMVKEKYVIKLLYDPGSIHIFVTEAHYLSASIFDFDFKKTAEQLLNQVKYEKKTIELGDGICRINGELSDTDITFYLDQYKIYSRFLNHLVKPNTKLVIHCQYKPYKQELYREFTFNKPVILYYKEIVEPKEPWWLY
ncbi:MAG: hypothetical protein QW607_04440 [Desulfurococcaceae archaeon]